jgi:hypothetical protein
MGLFTEWSAIVCGENRLRIDKAIESIQWSEKLVVKI